MNIYYIIAYPLFVIAAFNGVVGFFVLKENSRNSNLNRAVAAIAIFSAFFSLFAGIVYLRAAQGLSYDFVYRFCHIGWLSLPAIYQCTRYLLNDKDRRAFIAGIIFYPLWAIIAVLSIASNWIEQGVYSLIPFVDRYGPFEKPVRFLGGLFLTIVIYRLFKVRGEVSGVKKSQANYFILGALIYSAGAAVGAGFLQVFDGFRMDPALTAYFSLFWVAFTFYAITRYRLFDIQLAISHTVSMIIVLLGITAIHLSIFVLLEPRIGVVLATLVSFSIISVLVTRTPVVRNIQKRINEIILKDKYNYQSILKESTVAIVTILDPSDLLLYIINAIKGSMNIKKIALFLKEKDETYRLHYESGINAEVKSACCIHSNMIDWIKMKQQVFIKEEQERLMSPETFRNIYKDMTAVGAEITIPLFFKGNLIGLLILGEKGNGEPYLQSDIDILETLASQTAIAIENSRLYSEAITDGLTGLYHHAYFTIRLKEVVERLKRYNHGFGALMIDIDYFKKINDTYGHPVGDDTLRHIASLLKQNARFTDIVARYGGEEFAIIVPDTDRKGVLEFCERLRKEVETTQFKNDIKLTISIGVGHFCNKEENVSEEEVIKKIDKVLYLAKKEGRNRIEMVS